MLVQVYLGRFSRELGREVREVAPEAMERLRGYSWPGNIRELQSVLKQALLQASGTILLPAFLPELLRGPSGPAPTSPPGKCPGLEAFLDQRLGSGTDDLYAQAHLALDRILLPRVLEHTHGSQHRAARALGIARKTLRLRLRQLGLNITHPADGGDDDQP
jgi:two-component system nitrogen regulation response regulator GlnG